jgi:hypothetical protein
MEKVKNIEFYELVIEQHKTHLDETETFLKNFSGEITKIGLISKLSIFGARLNILIASYSKGSTKEELRSQFSEAVKVMAEVWDRRIVKMHMGKVQGNRCVLHYSHVLYALDVVIGSFARRSRR